MWAATTAANRKRLEREICAHPLTDHARGRIGARRIPAAAVEAAIRYGRRVHVRGALTYAIGRKEVARYRRLGVALDRFEGVQVACAPDGAVGRPTGIGTSAACSRFGGRKPGRGERDVRMFELWKQAGGSGQAKRLEDEGGPVLFLRPAEALAYARAEWDFDKAHFEVVEVRVGIA